MSRVDAEVLLQQGVVAARQSKPGTAAQCWQQMLALTDDADLRTQAYFNLGLLCQKGGNRPAARACFEQALEAESGNHDAREQLAALLATDGEIGAAIEHIELLVQHQPDARHHFNLGVLYSRNDDMDAAETHYRAGLTLVPDHADSLSNLGLILADRGMDDAALDCLKRAVDRAEPSPAACGNFAALLEANDQLDVAAHYLERAVALAPGESIQYSNLAVMRVEQRRFEEAEAIFRQALALDVDNHVAAASLGQLLLAEGRYAEGWRLHEARFPRSEKAGQPLMPALSTPPWRGESLHGKVLLLRQEQGFGDEIQFIRYLQRLLALGPARVILHCHASLLPLFAGLRGLECVARTEPPPLHDVWISTMSLPLYCGNDDIPNALPYLHAEATRVETWRRRVGECDGRLRVGLLWQGHRFHSNDAHRSLSSVELLAPLWEAPGVEFFSLLREPTDTHLPLQQFGSDIADFGDAAALIMQLDLVISVDSAYAHLTGALGKPIWTLLPASRTDWRWGYEGETSVWYPQCMRLFRQQKRGDWPATIAAVGAALRAYCRL